jgi:hypothetical protein
MALSFKTTDPNKLLQAFKKAINEGRIVTWSYDADGDFTHTAEQWKNSAWLRPKAKTERLVFNIIKPKNRNISSVVYAVYHGRFIESMLTHCDKLFTDADATAFPSTGDRVSE